MTHSQEEFYRELVTEYYPALLRYATQVLQDSFLAEDVVMDTLHTAFEKIDILYNAENPRAWLYAVLKNKLGNCIKKAKLESERIVSIHTLNESTMETVGNSEEVGSENHVTIMMIRDSLTEEENKILQMYCEEGMHYAQIAKELGTTVWACRKRIQRIREKLGIPNKD